MEWLKGQGFETVPYHMVTAKDVDREIAWFEQQIVHNDFPSDGLVALYDDIAYGDSLGSTSKFPRNSYAFNGLMKSDRPGCLKSSGVLPGQV